MFMLPILLSVTQLLLLVVHAPQMTDSGSTNARRVAVVGGTSGTSGPYNIAPAMPRFSTALFVCCGAASTHHEQGVSLDWLPL